MPGRHGLDVISSGEGSAREGTGASALPGEKGAGAIPGCLLGLDPGEDRLAIRKGRTQLTAAAALAEDD